MENLFQELYLSTYKKKLEGTKYYLASVKPVSGGINYAAFFSKWIGFKEDSKSSALYEERVIRSVDPEEVKNDFLNAGQQVAAIDSQTELTAALNVGGHFLIESRIMEEHWSEILVPKVVINTHDKGYVDYNLFAKPQLARFAKGKIRMEVMNRDELRCRICGKSPDDDRYLTLEVHHIKPWEEGGITEPANLITLCHLCHEGIDQVNRSFLWQRIGIYFSMQNHEIYTPDRSLRYIVSNAVTFKIESTKKTSR